MGCFMELRSKMCRIQAVMGTTGPHFNGSVNRRILKGAGGVIKRVEQLHRGEDHGFG